MLIKDNDQKVVSSKNQKKKKSQINHIIFTRNL